MNASLDTSDADLERQINDAHEAMCRAETLAQRRAMCALLTALVKQRSPQRVAEMERERGLA